MKKDISAATLTLFEEKVISSFLLIKVGGFSWTTLPYDYLGYSSDTPIVSIDPPKMSTSNKSENTKIALADPEYILRPSIETGFYGKVFEIKVGFLNTSDQYLVNISGNQTAPGGILEDLVTAYKGKIVKYEYLISPEGEVILSIEGGSPFSDFALTKSLLVSKSQIQETYPTDTSYDEMLEDSNQTILKWGKIS
jgi:hypothetical protein